MQRTIFRVPRWSDMTPETHFFQPDEDIPNNPDLPVLVYRFAAKSSDLALYFQENFTKHGWAGTWCDKIYDYTHFHSKSHEALGVVSGVARLQLGGPQGGEFDVSSGDIVVLPAGTGHRMLSSSHDFLVVGAYPEGQEDYDIMSSLKDDTGVQARIAAVPLPAKDPLTGRAGPLLDLWNA